MMNYNDALVFLKSKEVTAYEIHKYSGYSQSGLLRVFEGKVSNPRRKTKEVIIEYATLIQNNTQVNETSRIINKEIYLEKNGVKFNKDEVAIFVAQNIEHLKDIPVFKNVIDIEALKLILKAKEGEKINLDNLFKLIQTS